MIAGLLLALPTWNQSRQYADAETLYRTTIDCNHDCWMAYVNLGKLKLAGHVEEAMACFQEALRLNPDSDVIRANLARVLEKLKSGRESP
jgi:tetratricopeptide (TPR) repeat protein